MCDYKLSFILTSYAYQQQRVNDFVDRIENWNGFVDNKQLNIFISIHLWWRNRKK